MSSRSPFRLLNTCTASFLYKLVGKRTQKDSKMMFYLVYVMYKASSCSWNATKMLSVVSDGRGNGNSTNNILEIGVNFAPEQ